MLLAKANFLFQVSMQRVCGFVATKTTELQFDCDEMLARTVRRVSSAPNLRSRSLSRPQILSTVPPLPDLCLFRGVATAALQIPKSSKKPTSEAISEGKPKRIRKATQTVSMTTNDAVNDLVKPKRGRYVRYAYVFSLSHRPKKILTVSKLHSRSASTDANARNEDMSEVKIPQMPQTDSRAARTRTDLSHTDGSLPKSGHLKGHIDKSKVQVPAMPHSEDLRRPETDLSGTGESLSSVAPSHVPLTPESQQPGDQWDAATVTPIEGTVHQTSAEIGATIDDGSMPSYESNVLPDSEEVDSVAPSNESTVKANIEETKAKYMPTAEQGKSRPEDEQSGQDYSQGEIPPNEQRGILVTLGLMGLWAGFGGRLQKKPAKKDKDKQKK